MYKGNLVNAFVQDLTNLTRSYKFVQHLTNMSVHTFLARAGIKTLTMAVFKGQSNK